MLFPLTRKKFEELIPIAATGEQYRYFWGKPSDFLRRLLISIAALVAIFILQAIAEAVAGDVVESLQFLFLPIGLTAGLYWLWSPVFLAGRRNLECRKYKFSGFWQGEVVDVFVSEDLVGTEETVNKRGELVLVENRERRLNLEIGDDSGFVAKVQAPLKREHRIIRPGDKVEMLVMSNRQDLSRIGKISDVFLAESDLWVSDYPFLRRDLFLEVRDRLNQERLNQRRGR